MKRMVFFPENGCHHSSSEIYKGEQFYDEKGVCHPKCIDDPSKASYSLDVYAAKSLEFVRQNSAKPFFLTLAYTPPHAAFIVPELGIYNKKEWPLNHKIYAAMITRMDNEVGKLLDLLEELGIDENTLILFTSDNGNIQGNAAPGESLSASSSTTNRLHAGEKAISSTAPSMFPPSSDGPKSFRQGR
jgi:arylsulfatase A-like enzyme